MKNEVPDEQFDQLMRKLMSDAALDESAVNDIADSPTVWWGVQRRINEQKTAKSPWPPAWKRWLVIAVPTMAAVLLGALFFTSRAPVSNDVAFDNPQPVAVQPQTPEGQILPSKADQPPIVAAVSHPSTPKQRPAKTVVVKPRPETKVNGATVATTGSRDIKTDFIALSYARDPESGQIVRVRVPSSMMVTVGLVASVAKPSELVDAEVLVGDDGLTRAIRFIHKQ